jgi:hypothetical protein
MAVEDDEYSLLASRRIDWELEASYNLRRTRYEDRRVVVVDGLEVSVSVIEGKLE